MRSAIRTWFYFWWKFSSNRLLYDWMHWCEIKWNDTLEMHKTSLARCDLFFFSTFKCNQHFVLPVKHISILCVICYSILVLYFRSKHLRISTLFSQNLIELRCFPISLPFSCFFSCKQWMSGIIYYCSLSHMMNWIYLPERILCLFSALNRDPFSLVERIKKKFIFFTSLRLHFR